WPVGAVGAARRTTDEPSAHGTAPDRIGSETAQAGAPERGGGHDAVGSGSGGGGTGAGDRFRAAEREWATAPGTSACAGDARTARPGQSTILRPLDTGPADRG